MTRTPKQVASDIAANCDAYHLRTIEHADWGARQRELWDEAHAAGDDFVRAVVAIAIPSPAAFTL